VTFRSLVPIHGHPEASVLKELQGVGVPLRFAEDGMSISIDHDGTPPVAGRLDCRDVPDMVPILATLASRARGRTVLGHVAHVRLKESDRVASMLQLRRMGARVEFDGNDMEFEGVQRLHGASLSSFNDHRVLMALAIAGSIAEGVTELSYPHAHRISYPEFIDHMNAVGIPMAVGTQVPAVPLGL
jgi:3-phosphoshikimate 1-carboxyvinyltransferase